VREAAPKLLAALKKLVDRDLSYLSGYASITREEVEEARAVIAEAEGGPA
jgi:hypothetical protein